MKKRTLGAVLLITAMSFSLVACGSADNTETAEVEQAAEVSESAEENQVSKVEDAEANESDVNAEDGQEATGEELGTYPDGSSPTFSGTKLVLTIDGEEVVIAMYDNTAVDAFLERLPLEDLHFYDLSGIEKPADTPEEPFSLGEEEPGYDPVTGEMVIYRPWGNFTIFYGDFRHSDELVPLGKVESGLDIIAGQTEDFTGTLTLQ